MARLEMRLACGGSLTSRHTNPSPPGHCLLRHQDAPPGAEETITVPVDLTMPGGKPGGRLFVTVLAVKPPREARVKSAEEKRAEVWYGAHSP